ncbi:13277_t:CDS:1, partial [Gigaspora margarita]
HGNLVANLEAQLAELMQVKVLLDKYILESRLARLINERNMSRMQVKIMKLNLQSEVAELRRLKIWFWR